MTATIPTVTFPSFDAPSGTITGAAVTSEAIQLSGLFFAIYADRNHITESDSKQEYIDNIRKVKQKTDSLFEALGTKPVPNPDCSMLKRKRNVITDKDLNLLMNRSIISGLTNLVKDAANLVSCAAQVVDNLSKIVEAPVPPISEIENLTDTLNEIGKDLQEDKKPSFSPSESQPSSTRASSASSATSECTASSAVPLCTETVILSTSFYGTIGSSTVQSITTEICTTINGCGVSASTTFTTSSTATSTTTGGIICSTDCADCVNPVIKRDDLSYQRDYLNDRSLGDPQDFDSLNQYVMEQRK